MTKLLTTDEVAEMLGVPIQTLRQWMTKGMAPESFKMGRRRMFRLENVEAFVDQMEQAQREKANV
jgi:excisionase family DNA binding protein